MIFMLALPFVAPAIYVMLDDGPARALLVVAIEVGLVVAALPALYVAWWLLGLLLWPFVYVSQRRSARS